MSVEENKAVVLRWNGEIINDKRVEALGEVLAENYVHYNAADSSWSPDIQGLENAKATFFGEEAEEPSNWHLSVDDIIGEGDKVAARITFSIEGKPVWHAIVLYRLSDGKIVDDWACLTQIQD